MDYTIWQELYKNIDEFIALRPWKTFWDADLITVHYQDEDYYIVIMGMNDQCIGMSIFKGERGYEDLCTIQQEDLPDSVIKYIMYSQRCLTFYLGDKEEVPQKQRIILSNIGKKYTDGHYPFFVSFKEHYYPWTIDDHEVYTFNGILEQLIPFIKKYQNHEYIHNFEEMMVYIQDNGSIESKPFPEVDDKYRPITLPDESYYDVLKDKDNNGETLYIDLNYLNTFINDDNEDRPINALTFICYDKDSEMIITGDMLSPDEDDVVYVAEYLYDYIEERGKPDCICFRNPAVFAGIAVLCDVLDISMEFNIMEELNVIYEELESQLDEYSDEEYN